jgi:hypothetical protein
MLNENFVIIGVFINFLGSLSYIADTVKGKVRPNRVSWGIWALAVFIAFAAEKSQGVGILSLATFIVGFSPLMIFIASFVNKKAYWKITRFDGLCAVLSLLGLLLWLQTRNGNYAIMFSIFADLMAGIPTLIKSFRYPETENWIEFMSSFVNVSIALLTVKIWSFANFGFPLYILIFDMAAFLLIKFKLGIRFRHS